jgi:hypothetical protein
MFFLKFLTGLTLFSLVCSTIILRPTKNDTQFDAGMIFIQGAFIPANGYTQFSLKLQEKFNGRLWVALVEFFENLPDPLVFDSKLNEAFSDLKKAGLKLTSQTPFFFGGHSLGGYELQSFMLKNKKYQTLPVLTAGLFLEGAFVTRSNRENINQFQNLPILTLGAELDGLARITRMAESYYFNQNNDPKTPYSQITVVIDKMNHFQFSGEGNPPPFVVKNDIQPETSNENARDNVTSIVNSFMQNALNRASSNDVQIIETFLRNTQQLVTPLIKAFQLEGFYHFIPPCYEEKNNQNCSESSIWTTEFSQKVLGNISKIVVTDQFFIVDKPPEHFPKVNNNCVNQPTCVLNVTTVSQNVYSFEDRLDNGLEPVAAKEIKTKLVSRQAILYAITGKKYDFNQTDGDSLCALVNNESIMMAMSLAPKNTLERYLKSGIKIVPGPDDGPLATGPQWVYTSLVSYFCLNQSNI